MLEYSRKLLIGALQGSIKQDLAGMKDRLQSAASNRQTQQQILLQLEEEVSTLEKDLSALQVTVAVCMILLPGSPFCHA